MSANVAPALSAVLGLLTGGLLHRAWVRWCIRRQFDALFPRVAPGQRPPFGLERP